MVTTSSIVVITSLFLPSSTSHPTSISHVFSDSRNPSAAIVPSPGGEASAGRVSIARRLDSHVPGPGPARIVIPPLRSSPSAGEQAGSSPPSAATPPGLQKDSGRSADGASPEARLYGAIPTPGVEKRCDSAEERRGSGDGRA